MNLRQNSRINTEFNASSMTDIVFLLLIFFIIISSVVKDPALKLILPKGTAQVNVKNEIIRLSIDENLNYKVDNQKTTFDRLPFTLKAALIGKDKATVSIHGDKNIKYENVMDAVMIADQSGAKVVLALRKVK